MKTSVPKLKQMLDDKDNKVVLSAAQALISLKDEDGYQVYYEILTGERKTSKGIVAEQMQTLKDPKKLAMIGFEEGIGFVPFAGIGWEAYRRLAKSDGVSGDTSADPVGQRRSGHTADLVEVDHIREVQDPEVGDLPGLCVQPF